MNAFNKITTRYALIMLVFAAVAFALTAIVIAAFKAGIYWPALIPVVPASVYGCVAFFKDFKPGDKY